jgi:hypothetical protein
MLNVIIINVILFIVFFLIGLKSKPNFSKILLFVVLFIFACLNVAYYAHLFDNLDFYFTYRSFVTTDFTTGFSGFLVGSTLYIKNKIYKISFFILFLSLSAYAIVGPWVKLFINPMNYSALPNEWKDNICRQSRVVSTCGPCSMANVLNNYGVLTSENELAKEAFTSGTGTELWYLARCANRRGFTTKFVFDLKRLEKNSIIGISLGRTGHFISIIDIKDNQITLIDSLEGKKIIDKNDFDSKYKFLGMSLIINKSSDSK